MLRLAMITDPLSDAFNDGGVQAVTRNLVSAMAQRPDIEIHLLSFDYNARSASQIEKQGYTLHLIPGSRLGFVTAYAAEQKRVDDYLQWLNPDIVHSQGAGHLGIIAVRCKFPSIMTIHGILSEEARYIRDYRQKFRKWRTAIASEYLCIRRARNTILISPYVESYYEGRLTGRRFHIPNPVSPAFFNLQRRSEPGRILFAGRIYPLKGVSDLIEAVYQVTENQDVQLILAGALHDKQYVADLKRRVHELGIEDIVEFRGVLDQASLLNEFERASVLVLPSYQESAPMVIQEAMAAGLPVIASRVGGISDQIVHNNSGYLIDAGDVSALSSYLRDILNEPSRQAAFSDASRKIAFERYNVDVIVQKTIDTYHQVLEDAL